MLSVERLLELEEDIMSILPDKITEILSNANRSDRLEELLELMGLSDLLQPDPQFETFREGKIVVVGASAVKEDVLAAIGKKMGLDPRRFEFCLDYDEAGKYDYRKLQYAPQYRVVLAGPMPHSGHGKGESGSIISEIEKTDGYPRVERLISGQELKITKSNFKDKLLQLVEENYI